MGALRAWLLSVTAAAFAVALAQALTPAGTVKKAGKLVGGLVLLLAVVRPVLDLDTESLAVHAAFYGEIPPAEAGQTVLAAHIGDSTAAYIEQRAAQLGCVCTASVETGPGPEGWPVPASAVVSGSLTAAQRQALTALVTAELAIPAEEVYFGEGEG